MNALTRYNGYLWRDMTSLDMEPLPNLKSKRVLTIYRVLMFTLFSAITVHHLFFKGEPSLIYLTNWGLYFTFLFYLTTCLHLLKP